MRAENYAVRECSEPLTTTLPPGKKQLGCLVYVCVLVCVTIVKYCLKLYFCAPDFSPQIQQSS